MRRGDRRTHPVGPVATAVPVNSRERSRRSTRRRDGIATRRPKRSRRRPGQRAASPRRGDLRHQGWRRYMDRYMDRYMAERACRLRCDQPDLQRSVDDVVGLNAILNDTYGASHQGRTVRSRAAHRRHGDHAATRAIDTHAFEAAGFNAPTRAGRLCATKPDRYMGRDMARQDALADREGSVHEP